MINKNIYCNPISLPDYPIGRNCYNQGLKFRMDYRETADPTVIYEDGIWYLYPSCGMVYWTDDFVNWNHVKMEPYDCGYAPTVVKHKNKYYLLACSSDLYVSDSPLGPFKSLGPLLTIDGKELRVDDPMLFSDDDEMLYLYCGCGEKISGAQLNENFPNQLISELSVMFKMDTANHPWERMGEWNEDASFSWIEGAWMFKYKSNYYLTYSAPGTEWSSYSMGAYIGKSPLGPWKYMDTNPFLSKKYGIITGPGHGSIVYGPNNTIWVFYTCCMCYGGNFERRIGYDKLTFDNNGNIIPMSASEIPQYAPGKNPNINFDSNDVGVIPLTQHKHCYESSCSPGRDGLYAVDDSLITWWQPDINDDLPTLTVHVSDNGLLIHSCRIIWRDVGLSVKNNVMPGPFKYIVEAQDINDNWQVVLDKSHNNIDLNIDYNLIKQIKAKSVRLKILGKPLNIEPGVTNFTIFGSIKAF